MAPDTPFGRYRLQERLNPDGDTWLAEDLDSPATPVAVKILPEGTDVLAARHLGDIIGSVTAREINPLTDNGELPDGRPYLVYPVVEGTTLREFMNTHGPLPLSLAGSLIAQLGAAIEALHAQKIVYGSLAPEHIIVQQAHGGGVRAILLNAGAFRISGQTSASPGYLSPEQAAGKPTIASDIFSLGVVAAEMVTGKRPFRYGSLADLQRLQRIGIPRGALRKLRSRIPLRAEEEIRKATSWDPAHRPPDAAILGQRLAESLGTGRFQKRRVVLLALLGTVFAAVSARRCGVHLLRR